VRPLLIGQDTRGFEVRVESRNLLSATVVKSGVASSSASRGYCALYSTLVLVLVLALALAF